MSNKKEELWTTPFMPKDYNRGKHKFEFSQEYYQTQTQASNENRSTDDEIIDQPPSTAEEAGQILKDEEGQQFNEIDEYGEEENPFNFGDLEFDVV